MHVKVDVKFRNTLNKMNWECENIGGNIGR